MLTGDVRVVAQPSGLSDSDEDALQAVNTSSTTFVVWSSHDWFVYSLGGLLLSTAQLTSVHADILAIDVYDNDDDLGGQTLRIVWKTDEHGVAVSDCHTLRLKQTSQRDRRHLRLQSNVIALSRQRQLVYMMMMMMMIVVVRQLVYSCDENNDIVCYTRSADDIRSNWKLREGSDWRRLETV